MIPLPSYQNKKVVVLGLGKTGFSVIESLSSSGAEVYAWDDDLIVLEQFRNCKKNYHFIHPYQYNWADISAIVVSPGIGFRAPNKHWLVELAENHDCKITSDIELLLNNKRNSKFIGITGTNGKSTTTSLIGHILKQANFNIAIAGNIGKPALNIDSSAEIVILELSSYQIDLLNNFKTDIGILLNITPDHIERHGSFEKYAEIKKKLLLHSELSIFNNNIPDVYEELLSLNKQVIPISDKLPLQNRFGYQDFAYSLQHSLSLHISIFENIMAAYLACRHLGVEKDLIISAMKTFVGLKHRNEKIGKIKNITFINDSKATNAESTKQALITCDKEIYWIVGGISKAEGISPLLPHLHLVKKALLIGQSSSAFAAFLRGKVDFIECGNLQNAVATAYSEALTQKEEVIILLSPACASFDQWQNFEERGEAFHVMFLDLQKL